MPDDQIVAVGLLTRRDLTTLGPEFNRAWPLDETPCFEGLLKAIDEADKELKQTLQQGQDSERS